MHWARMSAPKDLHANNWDQILIYYWEDVGSLDIARAQVYCPTISPHLTTDFRNQNSFFVVMTSYYMCTKMLLQLLLT